MSIFNFNKKNKTAAGAIEQDGKSWWEKAKKLVKKKHPDMIVDENDPEYDAQKIYGTWLEMFK